MRKSRVDKSTLTKALTSQRTPQKGAGPVREALKHRDEVSTIRVSGWIKHSTKTDLSQLTTKEARRDI